MMIEDYIGMDKKKLGTFAGLVAGTAVGVTVVYCLIFGFEQWQSEVKISAQLMTAAATVPVAQMPVGTGSAGQYICPQHGAVGLPSFDAAGSPHCPCCGQIMQFRRAPNGNFALAAGAG
jgi:hypothetical protein